MVVLRRDDRLNQVNFTIYCIRLTYSGNLQNQYSIQRINLGWLLLPFPFFIFIFCIEYIIVHVVHIQYSYFFTYIKWSHEVTLKPVVLYDKSSRTTKLHLAIEEGWKKWHLRFSLSFSLFVLQSNNVYFTILCFNLKAYGRLNPCHCL